MQRTESEIQIDCLTRKLAEFELVSGVEKDCSANYAREGTINGDRNLGSNESEAILVVKRLQEQVCPLFSFLPPSFMLSLHFFFFSKILLFAFSLLESLPPICRQNCFESSCIFYFSNICHLYLTFILQIKMLEMEKTSSQQNLASIVELATEQNICAREKFDEVTMV